MSGAEAGLILAILPLCVTALEHHRDELRPFKSLFRYHKEIQRSAEDLGVAYVGFVQTIHLIFEEAGVADPDRLDRMVTSFDPSVWTDQTLESRLMDYFGKIVYEKRYRVVVRRIFDSIKDIAGILGYEIKGGGDTDIGVSSTQICSSGTADGLYRYRNYGTAFNSSNGVLPLQKVDRPDTAH